MRLLTRRHKVVAKAASTDETRYILQGVLVEETKKGLKTVATNGRMLAIVEDLKEIYDATEYPANVIPKDAPNGATCAIVPTESFLNAFKSIKNNRHLPILETVAIVMGKDETTLGTTNLESPVVIKTKNIEGQFPNYSQVVPTSNPQNFTISFNPQLLGKALKIAEEFGLENVKLEFTSNLNPVKITGEDREQRLTVVVMPMQPAKI